MASSAAAQIPTVKKSTLAGILKKFPANPILESFKLIGYLGSFLVVFLILSITLFNNNIIAFLIYLGAIIGLTLISYVISLMFNNINNMGSLAQPYCSFLHPGKYYSYPSLSTILISFTIAYIGFSIEYSENAHNVFLYSLLALILGFDCFTRKIGNCNPLLSIIPSVIIGSLFGWLLALILDSSESKKYYIFLIFQQTKLCVHVQLTKRLNVMFIKMAS